MDGLRAEQRIERQRARVSHPPHQMGSMLAW